MPSSTPRPAASSRVFREAGLVPGDHVAWCLENHRNFLSLAWGAYYAGLIYTPISSRLTTDEIAYIVDNSGAPGVRDVPLQVRSGRGAGRQDAVGRSKADDGWCRGRL